MPTLDGRAQFEFENHDFSFPDSPYWLGKTHGKKKVSPFAFSIFPLISRPTINHPSVMLCPHSQNETLRKALPLGEFQIDSVTSQHCFPPTDCEGLLALSFFMICTLCFQSHHSWPEAKPSSYLFVST